MFMKGFLENSLAAGIYWTLLATRYCSIVTPGIFVTKRRMTTRSNRPDNEATFKRRNNDTVSILMSDFGEKSEMLQVKNDFVRIKKLPAGTLTFAQMTQLPAKQRFTLYIETMKENYAFSKERKVDWNQIEKEYAKRLTDTTTTDQLFRILGEIVTLTKDHHTKVISEKGETLQYRGTTHLATLLLLHLKNRIRSKKSGTPFSISSSTRTIKTSAIASCMVRERRP